MKLAVRLSYALMHAGAAATVVTGIVYGVMRYFCESSDPFAVANHPLEPLFHKLHILAAPLLTLMIGAFWISHAWPRFVSGQKERRRSGISLLVTALPMVISGYLLQTTTHPQWHTLWVWLHGLTSVLWTLAFITHLFVHARKASEGLYEPD